MLFRSALDDLRDQVAEEIGVSVQKLPIHVIEKAAKDPLFLHHLITAGKDQFLLEIVVQGSAESERSADNTDVRSISLLNESAKASIRWIASGAKLASKEIVKKRNGACDRCPHRQKAPRATMYMVLGTKYICELCGCDVEKKALLLKEECPDKAFAENGRW